MARPAYTRETIGEYYNNVDEYLVLLLSFCFLISPFPFVSSCNSRTPIAKTIGKIGLDICHDTVFIYSDLALYLLFMA